MGTILVFAEQRDGALRRASLEALSEAARLAKAIDGSVEAVLVGRADDALVAELGSYGAARVHVFGDAALATYATEPYARTLAQVIAATRPWAVFIPFTSLG